MKMFKVRGSNDEVTTCECCGRENLKKTVMLEVLDADGNGTGQIERYGVDCAARAAGWTQGEVRKAVRRADAAATAERYREAARRSAERFAPFEKWVIETAGGDKSYTDSLWALGGFGPARAAYRAAVDA